MQAGLSRSIEIQRTTCTLSQLLPIHICTGSHVHGRQHYNAEDESEASQHCPQALPVQAEVHIVNKGECSAWDEIGLLQVLQCLCAQAEEVNSCHCQCMRFSGLLLLLTRPGQAVPQACPLLGNDWISHWLSVLLKLIFLIQTDPLEQARLPAQVICQFPRSALMHDFCVGQHLASTGASSFGQLPTKLCPCSYHMRQACPKHILTSYHAFSYNFIGTVLTIEAGKATWHE